MLEEQLKSMSEDEKRSLYQALCRELARLEPEAPTLNAEIMRLAEIIGHYRSTPATTPEPEAPQTPRSRHLNLVP